MARRRGGAACVGQASAHSSSPLPAGHYAPYQIQLDNGPLIFAPLDNEQLIKAADDDLAELLEHVDLLGELGAELPPLTPPGIEDGVDA